MSYIQKLYSMAIVLFIGVSSIHRNLGIIVLYSFLIVFYLLRGLKR